MQANKWQAMALVAGLMVSLSAGAQESVRGPSTGGGFGSQGGIVISADAQASLGYVTDGDDGIGVFSLEPSVDYFFRQNLSLGGSLRLRALFGDAGDATGIGLGARVGYNLPLGERISLWPKFGLELNFGDEVFPFAGTLSTDATLILDAYAPLLVHLTPSFFVGIGPRLAIGIGDDVLIGFNLSSTVGGHF